MTRGSWSSEHTDVSEKYITPTDVKQYVFCPRVTYFTRVVRLRPIMGSQQEAGQKSHDKISRLEKRRKSLLKSKLPIEIDSKQFDVGLVSERLGVKGRLDMLAITEEGEHNPVEFKDMTSRKGNVQLDHKYQLVILSLLVEDSFSTIVRRGFVHYMRDERTVSVRLTQRVKTRGKKYLTKIARMLESGSIPSPRRECRTHRVGCGYADQCSDF